MYCLLLHIKAHLPLFSLVNDLSSIYNMPRRTSTHPPMDPSLPPLDPSSPQDLGLDTLPPGPPNFTPSSPYYLGSPTPRRPPPTPYLFAASSPSCNPISPLGIALRYGCIYAPRHCHASFATREEWTQHEKSAHGPHPEIWYCGETHGLIDERCDVGFLDPDDLEDHLEEVHDIHVADDDDLWGHNIGVRTQTFWCGFCC
jgi:hypothetical protein